MRSIIYIILFCGAIQGAFLSVVIAFRNHGNKTANKIMSLFLLLFSFSIALHALGHKGYLVFLPDHELIITILIFAYNPLLYLYTIIQTGKKEILTSRELFHFIPVALISIFISYIFPASKGRIHIAAHSSLKQVSEIISVLLLPQYLIYFSLIIKEIVVYMKLVKESYSSTSKISLQWISLLLGLNTITWIFAFIISLIFPKDELAWDYVWIFVSVYMYLIGYFALNQDQTAKVDRNLISDKYKSSNLKADKADEIYTILVNSMQKEKIYLTEDLTLASLAHELDCTIHHLSQVINDKFDMNFSEYINRQRIEESKILIAEKDNPKTIADIAFYVGFNSLSSFNSAFKKFTSETPTQFKNKHSS